LSNFNRISLLIIIIIIIISISIIITIIVLARVNTQVLQNWSIGGVVCGATWVLFTLDTYFKASPDYIDLL